MKNTLQTFGSTPISTAMIASLYPDISGATQKVNALEKNGSLIRLKRGLYVVSPDLSGKRICTELIANHIYSPSYVSMFTALRWYGLIPERVSIIQSMTIKHSRDFVNKFGTFQYNHVSKEYFSIGLRNEEVNGSSFIISAPEKALCDVIANTSGVNLRYTGQANDFLESDLRLDMDAFKTFNKDILRQCAATGKKSTSIETILKLL